MLMEHKKVNKVCIKLEIEGKINVVMQELDFLIDKILRENLRLVFLGEKENAFYWYFFKLFRI